MSNTNPKTGLPFGVINGNSLDPELLGALYEVASVTAWASRCVDRKRELQRILLGELQDVLSHVPQEVLEEKAEELAEVQVDAESEFGYLDVEEPCAEIVYEGITLNYSYLGGAPLVISYDGPVVRVAAYCSPCVPGAADLDSGPGSLSCHGVPEDWLRKED